MRSFDSNIEEYDYAMQHMKCGKRYSEYRPFITTQSFHSSASRRRVYVPRFNRDFHLMSTGEYLALLRFEQNKQVAEIREQFPLDPRITNKLCSDECMICPGAISGGRATVMTTDFLVTFRQPDGTISFHAYQIKYDNSELGNRRTRSKLLIEKRYWESRGIQYDLILSSSFNKVYSFNLDYLFGYRCELADGRTQPRLTAEEIEYLSGEMTSGFRLCDLPPKLIEKTSVLCAAGKIIFPIKEYKILECPAGKFSFEAAYGL